MWTGLAGCFMLTVPSSTWQTLPSLATSPVTKANQGPKRMDLSNGWASILTEGSWAQVEASPSVSILVLINKRS